MQGTQAEFAGRLEEARDLYRRAWDAAQDDFDACVAAHYMARSQDDPAQALRWNEIALARAQAVDDERVHSFFPSLYVNLGRSHEWLGDLKQAEKYYQLAAAAGLEHESGDDNRLFSLQKDLTLVKKMNTFPENTVLLLIDVQKGFDDPRWGHRNNPQAEAVMARLLAAWRASHRPVFHVQHLSVMPGSPLRPENPGSAFKDEVRPLEGEPIFQKHVNSAFIGTGLEARLRADGYDTLVIIGLTTPYCVSTTARMAGNLGFKTYVVSDATAAFGLTGPDGREFSAEEVHALSLATIHHEFAEVIESFVILNAMETHPGLV